MSLFIVLPEYIFLPLSVTSTDGCWGRRPSQRKGHSSCGQAFIITRRQILSVWVFKLHNKNVCRFYRSSWGNRGAEKGMLFDLDLEQSPRLTTKRHARHAGRGKTINSNMQSECEACSRRCSLVRCYSSEGFLHQGSLLLFGSQGLFFGGVGERGEWTARISITIFLSQHQSRF